jgi:hypothetical protein
MRVFGRYEMIALGAKRSSVFIKSSSASLTLAEVSSHLLLMDWADRHCHASHYLMKRAPLYTEMAASAALVGLNRSDLRRGNSHARSSRFPDQL